MQKESLREITIYAVSFVGNGGSFMIVRVVGQRFVGFDQQDFVAARQYMAALSNAEYLNFCIAAFSTFAVSEVGIFNRQNALLRLIGKSIFCVGRQSEIDKLKVGQFVDFPRHGEIGSEIQAVSGEQLWPRNR